MKPLKEKVSITLDADIIAQIKSVAMQDDRSFSQYVNLVLREYIERNQSEKQETPYRKKCTALANSDGKKKPRS